MKKSVVHRPGTLKGLCLTHPQVWIEVGERRGFVERGRSTCGRDMTVGPGFMDLWTFGSLTRWVVILCIYVVDLVRFLVCVCHLIDCLIAVLFHLSYM